LALKGLGDNGLQFDGCHNRSARGVLVLLKYAIDLVHEKTFIRSVQDRDLVQPFGAIRAGPSEGQSPERISVLQGQRFPVHLVSQECGGHGLV